MGHGTWSTLLVNRSMEDAGPELPLYHGIEGQKKASHTEIQVESEVSACLFLL